MLFNSGVFAVFLSLVFVIYWAIPRSNIRAQNACILLASYGFYGWWDWRFLFLIFLSTTVDYLVSLGMAKPGAQRRTLLLLSLLVNLGILGYFKYVDFFMASFAQLLQGFGLEAHPLTLHLVLPVGISFYTFQTLSYTIDVYRGQIKPTRDFVAFAAFVSFFPQLVAGPIERAKTFLPQFQKTRRFDEHSARDGLRQILWGLFKKVVVADRVALYVDRIYADYDQLPPAVLALGAFYFTVQIYCDFSGYSDIATGLARLFGFRLSDNFRYPFFSRNLVEYKQRWHLSLTSWFRDYVFLPLALRKRGKGKQHLVVALLINALLIGLWHGPKFTFLCWSLVHALMLIPYLFAKKRTKVQKTIAEGRLFPGFRDAVGMALTFSWVTVAGVFFRAPSLEHALGYLKGLVSGPWWNLPMYTQGIVFCLAMVIVEWLQRSRRHGLEIAFLPRWQRWLVYYAVCAAILFLGSTQHVPYFYFQF